MALWFWDAVSLSAGRLMGFSVALTEFTGRLTGIMGRLTVKNGSSPWIAGSGSDVRQ